MSFFQTNSIRILQWASIAFVGILLLIFAVHQVSGLNFKKIQENEKEISKEISKQLTANISIAKAQKEEIITTKSIVCNSSNTLEDYKTEFISAEISYDSIIEKGDTAKITLKLKNTGTSNWYGKDSNCEKIMNLGTEKSQDRQSKFWNRDKNSNWIFDNNKNRIILSDSEVLVGEETSFEFEIYVPKDLEDGIYREFFRPMIPGFGWLSDAIYYIDIPIGKTSNEDNEKIKNANITSSTAYMHGDKNIEVNLSDQKMYLRYGEEKFFELLVSSGLPGKYDTPRDNWYVYNKSEKRRGSKWPHYVMEDWLGLARSNIGFQGYGLHSLPYLLNSKGNKYWDEKDEPGMHLGKPVSHGCVRMQPEADQIVWDFAEIGMAVWTHN